MKRIGIYYRVSTDKQDLRSQRNTVEKWIANQTSQPEQIVEFKDQGRSGYDKRRPAYRELMNAVVRKQIDTIVVYRLDRFSRSASDAIKTLLELDEYNVGFVSVTQPILNLGNENPFRRTMLAAFAEIAEIERETIIARVKAGLEVARKKGVTLGRPTKGTKKQLEKAKTLRKSGMSYQKIAETIKLSKGKVFAMLNNPQGE